MSAHALFNYELRIKNYECSCSENSVPMPLNSYLRYASNDFFLIHNS